MQELKRSNILNIPNVFHEDLKNFQGIGKYLYDMSFKFSDKIAQIDSETGLVETYGELNKRCVKLAAQMQRLGITNKDVVSICHFNTMDISVPIIGGIYVGSIISCIDPSLALTTFNHLLAQIKPKILFCTYKSINLLEKSIKFNNLDTKLIIMDETRSEKYKTFNEMLDIQMDESSFQPYIPDDIKETAFVVFSSGTTGLMKGICLSNCSLLFNNYLFPLRYHNAEISLNYSPFYWVNSLTALFTSFSKGTTRLLDTYRNADSTLRVIERYKVGFLVLSPMLVNDMSNVDYKTYNLNSVKYASIGGTPTTKEQYEYIEIFFPKCIILHSYGLTETSGIICTFDYSRYDENTIRRKFGSVGTINPGVSLKIVGLETGKILGPNEKGEIHIKSPHLMNGYYNQDSSDVWDEEGFLRTGDIGYYDEDRFLFIVDRIKDLLKFRCWHVTPNRIENVLLEHPAVKETVVIGITHDVDGDLALAIVVLNNGYADSDSIREELIKFVADNVEFKDRLHGGIKIAQTIPRTPTGKCKRRDLRIMVEEGKL